MGDTLPSACSSAAGCRLPTGKAGIGRDWTGPAGCNVPQGLGRVAVCLHLLRPERQDIALHQGDNQDDASPVANELSQHGRRAVEKESLASATALPSSRPR